MPRDGRPARGKLAGETENATSKSYPHRHSITARRKAQGPGQVVYSGQGHVVGRIEDGWLTKRNLDPKRHMLHSPPGWCTDREHLSLPIVGIRLFTTTGEIWEARLELWQRYGQPLDRQWGAQVLLLARYWHVKRHGVRQPLLSGIGA
jgi:hypothetical protein